MDMLRKANRSSMRRHPASAGFSLVEILVVIGIITILLAIIIPVVSKARESSKRTACSSNLRQLGQAMYMYAEANRGFLPNGNPPLDWFNYDGANAIMVIFNRDYVKAPGVFRCPGDPQPTPKQIVTADQTLEDSARMSYEFFFLWWPPEKGPMLTRMKGQAPLAWRTSDQSPSEPSRRRQCAAGRRARDLAGAETVGDGQLAEPGRQVLSDELM